MAGQDPITVAGAGLSGTLLAILLARRGLPVRLLERRPDMRATDLPAGRSINLALSTRGITALRRAGLAETVLADAIPMRGRRMHAVDGSISFQPYGVGGQAINSVSRAGLNETLLDAADATEGLELLFDHRVTDIADIANPDGPVALTVTKPSAPAPKTLASSALIGADGAFSAVRLQMMFTPGFDFEQKYLRHGYKELTIEPTAAGAFAMDPNALHIWPRGQFMLIALPNADRTFTCTLFMPYVTDGDEVPGFDDIHDDGDVHRLFRTHFPDAIPLIPNLTREFFDNPTGSLATMRCWPYHRGRSLVIGDAAHAVVPFYGQGMNAAMEDARVLDEIVGELPDADWPERFARFTEVRKPHCEAIADLAIANFYEMRDHVADDAFLQHKKLEKALHERIPEHYIPLYSMVSFSNLPYDDARKRAARQDEILAEVLPGIMGGDMELDVVVERLRTELEPLALELGGQ